MEITGYAFFKSCMHASCANATTTKRGREHSPTFDSLDGGPLKFNSPTHQIVKPRLRDGRTTGVYIYTRSCLPTHFTDAHNQYSIKSSRFVGKPERGSNVFLTYFDNFSGVNTNLGVERHQRGVKHPQPPDKLSTAHNALANASLLKLCRNSWHRFHDFTGGCDDFEKPASVKSCNPACTVPFSRCQDNNICICSAGFEPIYRKQVLPMLMKCERISAASNRIVKESSENTADVWEEFGFWGGQEPSALSPV